MVVACNEKGWGDQRNVWGGGNILYPDRSLGGRCMQLSKLSKCTLKIYVFHCGFLHPEKKLEANILNDILMHAC